MDDINMKTFYVVLFCLFSASLSANTWTSSFSEEGRNYQFCPWGTALSGIQCSGGYCDNLSLYCGKKLNKSQLKGWWTSSISEERRGGKDTVDGVVVRKNNYMQRCGTNGYIAGMQCRGAYCDNVALFCRTFKQKKPRSCHWTSWVSEENGGRLVFSPNKYAVAMECKGGYCDNKRFYVCN